MSHAKRFLETAFSSSEWGGATAHVAYLPFDITRLGQRHTCRNQTAFQENSFAGSILLQAASVPASIAAANCLLLLLLLLLLPFNSPCSPSYTGCRCQEFPVQ
jgi:hypothetical protein